MSRKQPTPKPTLDPDSGESDIESQADELEEVDEEIDEGLDETDVLDDKDGDLDEEEDADDDGGSARIFSTTSSLPKDLTKLSVVPAEQRRTSEFMTEFEHSKVIGTRATHIAEGAPIYVSTVGLTRARDIAIKELDEKKCPFSIARKVRGHVEIWEVNEMSKPW